MQHLPADIGLEYRNRLDVTELQLNVCQATGGLRLDQGESLKLVREVLQIYRGQIEKLETELLSCNNKASAH